MQVRPGSGLRIRKSKWGIFFLYAHPVTRADLMMARRLTPVNVGQVIRKNGGSNGGKAANYLRRVSLQQKTKVAH